MNEVVCHGIPDSRILKTGDVVSFDVSCYVGGVHGDNCATIVVGDEENDGAVPSEDEGAAPRPTKISASEGDSSSQWLKDWRGVSYRTKFSNPEEEERFVTARRLVRAALESRDEGVNACRPGGCLSDIGAAIHAVADAYG